VPAGGKGELVGRGGGGGGGGGGGQKNSPRLSVRPTGRETTERRVCEVLDTQDARKPSVRVINKRAGQVRTNVLHNLCEIVRPSTHSDETRLQHNLLPRVCTMLLARQITVFI